MWVKLGRCPSYGVHFLFFIHELIKLFPSYAARLSREALLSQAEASRYLSPLQAEGGSGLRSLGRASSQSELSTLLPTRASRGIRTILTLQSPRLCPQPGALCGSPDSSIWSSWNLSESLTTCSTQTFSWLTYVLLGIPCVPHICGTTTIPLAAQSELRASLRPCPISVAHLLPILVWASRPVHSDVGRVLVWSSPVSCSLGVFLGRSRVNSSLCPCTQCRVWHGKTTQKSLNEWMSRPLWSLFQDNILSIYPLPQTIFKFTLRFLL